MDVREPNQIYDDTVVKYTMNIPIELYGKITAKSRSRRVHRSVLIRNILEHVFVNERPATQSELRRFIMDGAVFECPDPPKRYHGFIGGLMRSSFRLNWFKQKRRDFIEKTNN